MLVPAQTSLLCPPLSIEVHFIRNCQRLGTFLHHKSFGLLESLSLELYLLLLFAFILPELRVLSIPFRGSALTRTLLSHVRDVAPTPSTFLPSVLLKRDELGGAFLANSFLIDRVEDWIKVLEETLLLEAHVVIAKFFRSNHFMRLLLL
mmetsp:Transcript_8673/g.7971  ORF Transcript_8673/g.7971 Transcript_8673/m.7971 type:complete len:149 (-) Transcript_8673:827-1273(-)